MVQKGRVPGIPKARTSDQSSIMSFFAGRPADSRSGTPTTGPATPSDAIRRTEPEVYGTAVVGTPPPGEEGPSHAAAASSGGSSPIRRLARSVKDGAKRLVRKASQTFSPSPTKSKGKKKVRKPEASENEAPPAGRASGPYADSTVVGRSGTPLIPEEERETAEGDESSIPERRYAPAKGHHKQRPTETGGYQPRSSSRLWEKSREDGDSPSDKPLGRAPVYVNLDAVTMPGPPTQEEVKRSVRFLHGVMDPLVARLTAYSPIVGVLGGESGKEICMPISARITATGAPDGRDLCWKKLVDEFCKKVANVTAPCSQDDCWFIDTKDTDTSPYPGKRLCGTGKTQNFVGWHRLMYYLRHPDAVLEIHTVEPSDREIAHLCRRGRRNAVKGVNWSCSNPWHLDCVTSVVNKSHENCWNGERCLCPHGNCVWTHWTGRALPCRNSPDRLPSCARDTRCPPSLPGGCFDRRAVLLGAEW